MSDANPTLPFGKHKGELCSDVPVQYLDWLIGQDWLGDDLREQIEEHLQSRLEWHDLDRD